MTININYGRRTGVTTFKKRVAEMCKLFHIFEPSIRAWVAASSLSTSDKDNIYTMIDAVNTACNAVKTLPDD